MLFLAVMIDFAFILFYFILILFAHYTLILPLVIEHLSGARRPIFTQENKHGIGPDRNKIEPAHGLSVTTFCSSLNM